MTRSSAVAAITTISFERGCFGCASGEVLMLSRDGAATFTATGSARHGTVNKTSTGTISGPAFDAVANELLERRFFELDDSYDDAQLRDGAWVVFAATLGGREKRVFRRDSTGPAGLRSIEAAVDAAAARIDFSPRSGEAAAPAMAHGSFLSSGGTTFFRGGTINNTAGTISFMLTACPAPPRTSVAASR